MRVKDKKIEDLIKSAYDQQLWLPEFQRPFVWDNNQVRLLIDSLYQNYTISSILTWEGNDELSRRRVGGSITDIKIPIDNNEESITYLLDGQQRTTALTYVFTDKIIYKSNKKKKEKPLDIYFDSTYKGEEAEKRWLFADEIIYKNEESEEHFTINQLIDNKELYKIFNTRFVKIKHAYDRNWDKYITETMFKDELSYYKFKDKYKDILRDLQTSILEREIIDIEQKGDLNSVLEVFERINTKNTKLSIFDIMVAKTYRKFDQGYFDLRTYIKVITSENPTVQDSYFDNLDGNVFVEINKNPFDDGTTLFLIMLVLKKQFQAKYILKISTTDLINEIKQLHFIIKRSIEILNNSFYIEYDEIKKYQPISKFIVSFLSQYKKDTEYSNFLGKWLWNTLLYNRYPGAQNERIEKDIKRVNTHIDNLNSALIEMKADNTRNFDYLISTTIANKQLLDCSYSRKSSQLYKTMLLVFKSNNLRDFYTGEKPSKDGSKITKLEEHHIFPLNSKIGKEIIQKYKNTQFEDIINNIANLSLITKETNNNRINNKNPSVYIQEFESSNIESFYQNMKSQFITSDMIESLKRDNFEEFIIARTKLIHTYIMNLTRIENE